jgi:manganese transport protein
MIECAPVITKGLLAKLPLKWVQPLGAVDMLKYIGPGFLVTIGFIDPGNWAATLSLSSLFGSSLIWVQILVDFPRFRSQS